MWVFACGMFRSGSTLQFQLLSAMIERAGLGRRTPWAEPEAFAGLAPEFDDSAEMLVFKTHVCKHPMRQRLADGRAIAIGSHRDLRDVAVSGADKAGVEPSPEYCRELMTGLMATAEGWSRSRVFELSYHSLSRETGRSCLRMAAVLGIPLTEQQARELAKEFAPGRQRQRIEQAIATGELERPHPDWDVQTVPGEQLHTNHLAGGATDKWRERLCEESVAVIEDIAGDWLAERGYPLVTKSIDTVKTGSNAA